MWTGLFVSIFFVSISWDSPINSVWKEMQIFACNLWHHLPATANVDAYANDDVYDYDVDALWRWR